MWKPRATISHLHTCPSLLSRMAAMLQELPAWPVATLQFQYSLVCTSSLPPLQHIMLSIVWPCSGKMWTSVSSKSQRHIHQRKPTITWSCPLHSMQEAGQVRLLSTAVLTAYITFGEGPCVCSVAGTSRDYELLTSWVFSLGWNFYTALESLLRTFSHEKGPSYPGCFFLLLSLAMSQRSHKWRGCNRLHLVIRTEKEKWIHRTNRTAWSRKRIFQIWS